MVNVEFYTIEMEDMCLAGCRGPRSIFISSANTHTIRVAGWPYHYHAMVRNYISRLSDQTFYVVSSFLSPGFFEFVTEEWTTHFSPWECAAPDYAIENGKDLVTSRKTWRWDQNNDHTGLLAERGRQHRTFLERKKLMEDQSENELQNISVAF
jgi:hypothetical protein